MSRKLLIVDDDPAVRAILKRVLGKPGNELFFAEGGEEALGHVRDNAPDLIILDIKMPDLSGSDVLKRLRGDARTQMIPVMFLTGQIDLRDKVSGFEMGVDDYVTKPFEPEELSARVEGLLKRAGRQLSANPLTRLPGGPAIEEEVSRRIQEGGAFAFFYIDIDHFKAFNDLHGYQEGDRVIQDTADLLLLCLRQHAPQGSFAGHVGGDDFVLVTSSPEGSAALARDVTELFDRRSPAYYSDTERERGCVTTKDRLGVTRTFPMMSLSVAVVTTEKRLLDHYGKVVDIAAEIKRYLKSRPGDGHSVFLKDRRRD